jgi:hypothetical protein
VVGFTATADSGSSTLLVVELLGLVGLILGLLSNFWLVSRSESEAGFWALIIVVGELLLVPMGFLLCFGIFPGLYWRLEELVDGYGWIGCGGCC